MINTGDRMLDSTFQMLFTTIVGGLVTGLITLYTKGLWKDTYNKLRGIISKNSYNPLEFDPSLAPEKPLNGVCYLYRYNIRKPKSFYSWFYLNHGSKLYTQKLKNSLEFLYVHLNTTFRFMPIAWRLEVCDIEYCDHVYPA